MHDEPTLSDGMVQCPHCRAEIPAGTEVLHAFIATPLEPAPNVTQDPDEAIDNVTMTVEEAQDACRSGTIRDGKTIATLLLAKLHRWL